MTGPGDTPRGPLGDARSDAADPNDEGGANPSLPQEEIEDRDNVDSVKPEDYPDSERESFPVQPPPD